MSDPALIITPRTKVGELLDAFPELEKVLLELSPAFARLKNPLLRKTVARIATLQQVAAIGGIKTDELVNRLRLETGQQSIADSGEPNDYLSSSVPAWFDPEQVSYRYDAVPIINTGGSPMSEIISLANKLLPQEILELTTPFIPAPIIDMLRERGFKVYIRQQGVIFLSYVIKEQRDGSQPGR